MRIAVRMEGGIGDHILANRFVKGIRDIHADSTIDLFSSTNGSTTPSEVLNKMFDFYENTILTHQEKEEYQVQSQFGIENHPQHFDNIEKTQLDSIKSYDKTYNLHIDALDWMSYDFDWQRYFYSFPPPTRNIPQPKKEGAFIVVQIASANLGNNHRMTKEYISTFLKTLARDFKTYILSTPQTAEFVHSVVEEGPRTQICATSLGEVISLIRDCSGFFGIDSGMKYIAHTFNKPTLCWARESTKPHSTTLAHNIRWLTFPQLYFPLEFDAEYMKRCMKNLIETDNFFLAPHIESKNLTTTIIKREFK